MTKQCQRFLCVLVALVLCLAAAGPLAAGQGTPALPAAGATVVAAGRDHTCALMADGSVRCWGSNEAGQLGDGTTTGRGTPMDVIGLTGRVVALAAGYRHTCAAMAGGGVMCWGANDRGQLGDGTTTDRLTPVWTSNLTESVIALAAGDKQTCAVTAGRAAKCWGGNLFGELGDGTRVDRPTPAQVSGLTGGVSGMVAGYRHTCARMAGGGAMCWGDNGYGQLGDGSNTLRVAPVAVGGLTDMVSALAAGWEHTCALLSSGAVKCWGSNSTGQVGDDTTAQRTLPAQVSGLTGGVSALAGGDWHTCAVVAGGVKCWGSGGNGQLGDGARTLRRKPVQVSGLTSGVSALAGGQAHTCALLNGGALVSWGANFAGQLGNGDPGYRQTPVPVSGLTGGVSVLAGGESHDCVQMAGGGFRCWGNNMFGQLGDGTYAERLTPVPLSVLGSGVAAVAPGGFFTCARMAGGGVQCWGANWYGQLGDGTIDSRNTPAAVTGLGGPVTALVTGNAHACALIGSGVKCWGYNGYGQLGNGDTLRHYTPVDVSGLTSGVSKLAAGSFHNCALLTGGAVKCWGDNESGQLGDGTYTSRNTPVQVSGLTSGVIALAPGGSHTCALLTGGAVKCWGWNGSGEVGDGTRTQRLTPVDVSGLTGGVAALAAGDTHTCALLAGGAVQCWGQNTSGQLGDGTQSSRNAPVDVSGLTSGVSALGAGSGYTCALRNGGVQCWGAASMMGSGVRSYSLTPVPVVGTGHTVSGHILDTHGNRVAGATVSAGAGITAASDSSGRYVLHDLPGGAYTLTPAQAGYAFWPPSRSVTVPPDVEGQDFVLLAAPVSTNVTIVGGVSRATRLTYTDTQGLPTTLDLPAGAVAVTTTVTLTPVLAQAGAGWVWVGHAFDLALQGAGGLQEAPSLSRPVTLTLRYSARDVWSVSDVSRLALWRWNGMAWEEAAQTCAPPSSYRRDAARGLLALPVCRAGRYALFGPTRPLWLPLVRR